MFRWIIRLWFALRAWVLQHTIEKAERELRAIEADLDIGVSAVQTHVDVMVEQLRTRVERYEQNLEHDKRQLEAKVEHLRSRLTVLLHFATAHKKPVVPEQRVGDVLHPEDFPHA